MVWIFNVNSLQTVMDDGKTLLVDVAKKVGSTNHCRMTLNTIATRCLLPVTL